jgi:hypothetical protein
MAASSPRVASSARGRRGAVDPVTDELHPAVAAAACTRTCSTSPVRLDLLGEVAQVAAVRAMCRPARTSTGQVVAVVDQRVSDAEAGVAQEQRAGGAVGKGACCSACPAS